MKKKFSLKIILSKNYNKFYIFWRAFSENNVFEMKIVQIVFFLISEIVFWAFWDTVLKNLKIVFFSNQHFCLISVRRFQKSPNKSI